jgi:hypothetical protein
MARIRAGTPQDPPERTELEKLQDEEQGVAQLGTEAENARNAAIDASLKITEADLKRGGASGERFRAPLYAPPELTGAAGVSDMWSPRENGLAFADNASTGMDLAKGTVGKDSGFGL